MDRLFPELAAFTPEDWTRIGTSRPVLMIAMTARTGSSHLCSGLASAFQITMPTELFNARGPLILQKHKRGVTTFAELLQSYYADTKDLVLFKASWTHFAYFEDSIFRIFPNLTIVYLNRLDTEAQAVSLFRAKTTGYWHDSKLTVRKTNEPVEETAQKFDLRQICRAIQSLEREKAEWERFFFANQLQPLRVFYEHFVDDLSITVRQIAKYAGRDISDADQFPSAFSRVSDSLNEEWLAVVRDYRRGFFQKYRAQMRTAREAGPTASDMPSLTQAD